MQYLKIFAVFLALVGKGFTSDTPSARWCTISVAEQNKCNAMKDAFQTKSDLRSPPLSCVQKADWQGCVDAIGNGEADLVTLDGGHIHSGGKSYNLRPIMEELYTGGAQGYKAIAVVQKTNTGVTFRNLKGKKSCHTGYGRTAGWNIPVGYLLQEGLMESVGCKEDGPSAAAYFAESCVPGIKSTFPSGVDNLCTLCGDDCTSSSKYVGYDGAFRCLVETDADVAFIKPATVMKNTDGENQDAWASNLRSADFEILCPDGTRAPVSEEPSCYTAQSPSHAVVTSGAKSDEDIKSYQKLLSNAQVDFKDDDNAQFTMFDSQAWGGSDLLFKDSTTSLSTLTTKTSREFLGDDYYNSLEGLLKCPDGTYRFCTTSAAEQNKCKGLAAAIAENKELSKLGALSCFQAESHLDCAEYIENDNADLVALDGGDIYEAGKKYGLISILSENYGNGDASYWAVAVAKADTSFTMKTLQGKKSCHTGIMKTSGWIIPIGQLVTMGEIIIPEDGTCDVPGAVGEYFAQSCAPGALSTKYNPYGTNPANLCDLCIGVGANKCARNDHEPYYNYDGAFKCLVDDAGEVAFVKHTTATDYTNDNNLNPDDYQLLCPDGSRQKITAFKECNLAKVSSHAVVTDGEKGLDEIESMMQLLHEAGITFHDGSDVFQMFESDAYGGSDLLFKDATQSLVNTQDKRTYNQYLSEEYIKSMEALQCSAGMGLAARINTMVLFIIIGVGLQRLMMDRAV